MKYKIYIFFALIFFTSFKSYGQDLKKMILTHENINRLDALNPSLVTDRESNEAEVLKAMNKNRIFKDKTIAVVFHILYLGESTKTSENQVFEQIEALNRDFSGAIQDSSYPGVNDSRFRNRSTNPQLKFCFPAISNEKLDPVNYIQVDREEWEMDDLMKSTNTGGADPWDVKKYLNIWIVDLANGTSGYAQVPGGPKETDGIVIDYQFFYSENTSDNINQGKTLTHLVGNYLGLYSLWGNGECEDDLVQDTPIHSSPNYSCGSDLHVSFCGENVFEMPMNFMDSTPDDCQSMFTFGQKRRIHAFLSVPTLRGELTNTVVDCDKKSIFLEEGGAPFNEVKNNVLGEGVHIFPNPTNRDIVVRFFKSYGSSVTVSLIDQNGRSVKKISGLNAQKGVVPLSLGSVAPGTYYLSFSKNGDSLFVKRLIVTH